MAITGEQIVNAAEKYSGVPYFEGNPQSRNGMDCSGLVQATMRDLGVNISRTTVTQLADANTGVVGKNVGTSLAVAQQGDILHYVGHEEIWIGNRDYGDGKPRPLVFSEATPGTSAAVRNRTPWPIIGIVRYAGSPGSTVGGNTTPNPNGDPGRVSGQLIDIVPGLSDAVSLIKALTSFIGLVGQPGFWVRTGAALLGAALLIIGLHGLMRGSSVAEASASTIKAAVNG